MTATITPKPLVDGVLLGTTLAGGAGVKYTCPVSPDTTASIRSITLCNLDTVTRIFSMWIVPLGGSEADAKQIFVNQPILAGETLVDDAIREILAGGFLSAIADVANKISLRVDGAEVT